MKNWAAIRAEAESHPGDPQPAAIHIEDCENGYVGHNVSVGHGPTVEIVKSKNITTERNINIPQDDQDRS